MNWPPARDGVLSTALKVPLALTVVDPKRRRVGGGQAAVSRRLAAGQSGRGQDRGVLEVIRPGVRPVGGARREAVEHDALTGIAENGVRQDGVVEGQVA